MSFDRLFDGSDAHLLPAQPDTAALQRKLAATQALSDQHFATILDLREQLAAQEGQEPAAQQSIDKLIEVVCDRVHTWARGAKYGNDELNKRLAGNEAVAGLKAAIASNSLAIVRAALEAAAETCETWPDSSPRYVAKSIRAIDPQTILDGMTK